MILVYFFLFLLWLLPFEFGDERFAGIPIAYYPFFVVFYYFLHKLFYFRLYITKLSYPPILIFFYLILGSVFSNHPISGFFYSFLFLIFFSPLLLKPKSISLNKFEFLISKFINIVYFVSILGLLNIIRVSISPPPGYTIFDLGTNPFLFMNKNAFIFFYVPAVPLSYYYYFRSKLFYDRVKFVIITLSSFLLMSRSAIVATIIILILIFIHFYRNTFLNSKNIIKSSFAILLISIFLSSNTLIIDKLSESINIINILTGDVEFDFRDMHRAQIVAETKNMIMSHPLFGVGIGTQNFVSNINPSSFESDHQFTVPHNFYLSITAQLGIPIAIFLCFFLFYLCILFYRKNLVKYSIPFYISLISIFIMFIGMEYFFAPFIWINLMFGFFILKNNNFLNDNL
jgi:O-antigen ligase